MKKILLTLGVLSAVTFLTPSYANTCSDVEIGEPNFCSKFTAQVRCECKEKGKPISICENAAIDHLLHLMLAANQNSIQKSCDKNNPTDPTKCVQKWNHYIANFKGNKKPCT